MSESKSHKQAKRQAAGRGGKTEVPISRNRRLDAVTPGRATEVELSGNFGPAARRLRDSGKNQKVMVVRQNDMNDAAAAMRNAGVHGTVKNLKGSSRRSV